MKKDLQIVRALIKEMASGDCCKECGGMMYEGMCTECGYMEETSVPNYATGMENEGRFETPQSVEDLPQQDGLYYVGGFDASKKWVTKEVAEEILSRLKVNEDHQGTDHEVSMANNSIDSIIWAAGELKKHLQGGERDIPAWIQDHITNAENYILQAAKNYHEYGSEEAPEQEPETNDMSLSSLMEAKKKPSAGLTKKQKSAVAKKARAGKDIGGKGKGFEKVAKKAAKKYGSAERGRKVAAAAMWKNVKRK